MPETSFTTTCCIVGGGPAGMMAGLLFARAGIDVIVIEKHRDFFRDFRGDTIHPSTFELMHELGMLKEFLKVPHQEFEKLGARFNRKFVRIADFTHLRAAKRAVGLMPQWDFLNFLEKKASSLKTFHLLMETQFTDLLTENNKVTGIKAKTPDGTITIQSTLVIAADGRRSDVREKAGLKIITEGVPIDVLWFRLPKQKGDDTQSFGNFYNGKIMVMLDRNDYWQCGYVISKGGFDKIKPKGLSFFRDELGDIVPFLKDRTAELQDWDQVKLLSVAMDHLETWYAEGLLCIGDAAHAMSPVGGVGINLAIQDAVAAANILCKPLLEKKLVDTNDLKKVQKRREYPTRFTQRLQLIIQRSVISKRLENQKQKKPPFMMRLINWWPYLQRIPAKVIGMGIRPEHIHSPSKD